MKAFIERVFKSKQQKQKELLDEIANTETTNLMEQNKEILSKQIEVSIKKQVKELDQHTDTKED